MASFIEKLNTMVKAMQDVNEEWEQLPSEFQNRLSEKFPLEMSFDEVVSDVSDWVQKIYHLFEAGDVVTFVPTLRLCMTQKVTVVREVKNGLVYTEGNEKPCQAHHIVLICKKGERQDH